MVPQLADRASLTGPGYPPEGYAPPPSQPFTTFPNWACSPLLPEQQANPQVHSANLAYKQRARFCPALCNLFLFALDTDHGPAGQNLGSSAKGPWYLDLA